MRIAGVAYHLLEAFGREGNIDLLLPAQLIFRDPPFRNNAGILDCECLDSFVQFAS
jgi:hypothetical protein